MPPLAGICELFGLFCSLPPPVCFTMRVLKFPTLPSFHMIQACGPKKHPSTCCSPWALRHFCVFLSASIPPPLYALLPYPVEYVPYTAPHVVGQTQLLFFSALAFTLLLRAGIYPAEIRCINLDADWFYRKGGKLFFRFCDRVLNGFNRFCDRVFVQGIVGDPC